MSKFRDHLWLWGQTAGTHTLPENYYNTPGVSRMTPFEGAIYFGIPNMCRVVMAGLPVPPFDQEALAIESIDKVVWSIVGSGGSPQYAGGGTDIAEVLRMARKYDNVVGGIMDDFLSPGRRAVFTPDMVKGYRDRLATGAGRKLDLWTVIYEHELVDEAIPYLAHCDVASFWTWHGSELVNLDANLKRLRRLFGPDKPVYVGLYMWDYGDKKELSDELMKYQLERLHSLMHEGAIEGVIVCSNCIADIGIRAADMTRDWINQHGDEEITGRG